MEFLNTSVRVKDLLAYIISSFTLLVSLSVGYAEYKHKDATTQTKLETLTNVIVEATEVNKKQNEQLEKLNILLTELKIRVELKK